MANKKKKKVKSAFEVLDQKRNEEIAQMSKGSSSAAKKLNKILAPSSKEQISSGTIKTNNSTSISYATTNTRDISRQIIAPTSSMFSSTTNELSSPVDLVKNMQAQQENERQKRKVEQLKKKVEQEKQNQGILTPTEMQDIVVNENFGSKKNYLPDNVKTQKTQLDKQREKATGHEIKKAIAPVSEIAKQNNKKLENYKKTSDTYKNYIEEENNQRMTEYLANKEKVNNEETTLFDKLNPARAILSGLESATTKGLYKDKNGNNILLPSYNKLKTQKVSEDSNFIGKSYQGAMESVGHMIPSMVASLAPGIGKATGLATTWATTFNTAENDKLLEGYSEKEAKQYATINATLETALGGTLGGITKIMGGKSSALSTNIQKLTDKIFKNKGASRFVSHVTSEAIEEEAQTFLDPINEHLTLGKYNSLKEALNSVELEDVGITALSTLMTVGLTEGKSSYDIGKLQKDITKVNKKYGTDFRIKNDQKYNENLVINKEIENRINKQENTNLSTKEKNKIKKEVQEDLKNGNLSIDTIESVLAEKEYNKYKQEENKIKELKSQLEELNSKKISDLTVKDYEDLNTQKKAIEEQISNLSNSTSKQELQTKMRDILSSDNGFIQKSYQEANLKNEKFTYETKDIDSDYRKTLTKEFEDKGNNSTKAHNQYEMLVKLSEDKGVQYHITNNKELSNINKNISPSDIEGFVRTNKAGNKEILINIDSERAINRIVGHETTHLFEGTKEYDELKDFAKQYATTKGEYDSRLKSTQELYKNVENTNIENEVTANIVGDYIFTDTDFINNLSTEKPNIFKRVYEEVKHLYKMATAGSKEERQLLQLKKSFENAYKNVGSEQIKNKSNNNIKLSIQKDEKGNKYVNVDTDQDIFDGKTLAEQTKIAKKYILDSFREKGLIKDGDIVNITSRTANEYTHPRNQLPVTTKSSKMKASTELDNLLTTSKYKYSKSDDGRHPFAKDGWDYYETTFKVGDNSFTGLVNIGKSGNKKTLYDITNIKRIAQNRSTSANAFSTLLSNSSKNNISQSNTNVKSDTSSTKYSIQNNENDTQRTEKSSFSYDENAKRYEDLIKTNNIKYYRKSNGDVSVLLTDSKNNVVNEFNLWSNTQATKELGEKLGTKIYETSTDRIQTIELNNNNINEELDYFMSHRPTKSGITADNLINQEVEAPLPKDMYEHPEWYFQMNEEYSQESMKILSKIRNNPNADITIYRATTGDKINPGDWVTLSKEYAKVHNEHSLQGKGNIVEMKVKAKDVQFAGDDINEWGYFPNDNYSLSNKNKQIAPSKNDIFGSDIKYRNKNENHKQIAPIVKENKIKAPVTKDMLPYIEMGKIVSGEASYKEVENFLNNTNGEKEPKLKKGTLAPVRTSNTKLQQIKDRAVETVHWGQYLVTNRNEAIDRYSKQTGNKNIKFLADHLNNVQGEISTNINNAQIDNNGKKIGKSLVDIFVPAKKEKLSESFNDYLFNLSNIERHKQGKGSLVSLNESETLVKEYEKTYPQMKNWAKDVNAYNKNLLYKQAEAGLITKDTADYLSNKYKFYVPFIENIDGIKTNDTGKILTKSTVKSARGGSSKNLLGFEEAMIRQTQSAITQIRKNQLYNEIIETMPEKTIDFETNTNPNIFEGNLTTDKQNYLLSSYKDGKMQQAKISKELYRNLENKHEKGLKELEAGLSFITKPLQKISNVRRNILTTWSPSFFITNPIKDLQDAPLNSKYAKDWSKNIPKSFKELATGKGEHLNEFLNMYGQGNLWGGENVDSGVYDITKATKPIVNKSKNKIVGLSKSMLKKTTQINELMELAPRYAEYLASIENGTTQMEALYNAREVTTNFGRGGIITKALNRNGFTFLNASTQGFSKLIRNFSGENGTKGVIGASAKVIALGVAPALFNALWFDDDDDYNDLPDYIKDNYYLFKTDDNDFIRIPKGRMISIFGSAARRTLERNEGKRNEMTLKEDIKSYVKNAWSQVGVGDLGSNNILAPILQATDEENGKAWYGSDIVPKRLQDKPKNEQYDSSIDKASIWIGKKLGISPYKINYVIDQYSGGIGDMILPTITDEAQSDSNSVIGTMLAPLKDKFTANSITDNKNVSNFYTKSNDFQTIANGSNATSKDKLVNQYMKSISYEMGALYQEMREVQENNDLSKSEKFKKALIIKDEINKLAKEGMEGYKKVENAENYGIVGEREFYKWTNDEGEEVWSSPKEKDLITLNSFGLTINEKNEYYQTQSAMYDSWNKYDDYNKSKAYAIGSIIKSNLPDEAKYQLYNNSYSKDKINIAQTLGIKADEFLSYEKQNFKANKDKNGKSISGSKKNKVYNYLNKMNIDYEEKLILAKMQGYDTDEGNVEIVNYLNNINITNEEYEKILKQLKFTVKNGYVRWD